MSFSMEDVFNVFLKSNHISALLIFPSFCIKHVALEGVT